MFQFLATFSPWQVGAYFPLIQLSIQLLMLSSRDLAEAPVGPRSVVVSSPDKIGDCKWELEAHTEKFIEAIEVSQGSLGCANLI